MKRKFYESTKRKAIDDLNTIIKIIKIVVYKKYVIVLFMKKNIFVIYMNVMEM